MGNPWFESVAEAQRLARERLSSGVYAALVAGSEQGLTAADGVAAFAEPGGRLAHAGLAARRDLAPRPPGSAWPDSADQLDGCAGGLPAIAAGAGTRVGRRPPARRPLPPGFERPLGAGG
ncbi:MAG: (S)-2-hydroxy-acid oxidase [Blastococcus sp.]|nr:(S)-2-hydroxy-acid oxidase [Blastococcus sp.]